MLTQRLKRLTLLLTLFVTLLKTSYAQLCGPANCKCLYRTSGLAVECSGPTASFDWATLPSNAVTLTLQGFDLGPSVLPARALFSLREFRINNCTNVPAVLKPALATNLPKLNLLDLSSNSLTTVPSNVLSKMTSLTTLDLSSNQIKAFPSFAGMTQLADILIGQNPVTSLPCTTFQGLPNLVMIDLSDTNIKGLSPCLFAGLTSLVKLSITRTDITTIPSGSLKDLTSLQYLFLNHNQISTLPPGTFGSLGNVIALSLAGNYLTDVPDFTGLTKLQFLDLDDNLFSTIPDGAFGVLPSVTELDLRQQSLLTTVSPNAFTGLPSLMRLALEDCVRLETLPEDVFAPLASSLKMLFISNNGMTTIKESWFNSLSNLFWLAFTNNPLVCDCNLQWLHTAYTTKKYAWSQSWPAEWKIPNSFVAPKCYLPTTLRGKLFSELIDTDFSCSAPEVTPVIEKTVTLPEGGVAHLQALVSGEYPTTTWETPGGKKVAPVPWTSLLPYPWNLTVLPSPSALKPPSFINASDPSSWRSLIPKPFDAFLPPMIPLPDNPGSATPKMAAASPFTVKAPPFPFKSFIPPPFPYKDFIPAPFQAFIPPSFPYAGFVPGAGDPKMAEAAGAAPFTSFIPPPFPYKDFIPSPFQTFIPPSFPYAGFIPGAGDPKMAEAAGAAPFTGFIPPPFPYKDFIPAPFQAFIPPSFPYAGFTPGSAGDPKMAEAAGAFPFKGFIPPPFPYQDFIPSPIKSFIPPSFPYAQFIPNAEDSPAKTPFLWVPPPGAQMAAEATSDSKSAPWLMFLPPPLRDILPLFPNISLTAEAFPGAPDSKASNLPAPWMMFVPAPFHTFIPILPNGSFPVPPATGADGPFKAQADDTDGESKPPAPWMMFIPTPFRAFIPILPNGSFPVPPSPAQPFGPLKIQEADPADSTGDSKLPAPWMMFIPAPFRAFIPILPNGSFPLPTTPAEPFGPFKAEAAGSDGDSKLPAPWMMFVPVPFRAVIPILPNGSFPVPPSPAGGASPFKMQGFDPSGLDSGAEPKLPAPWMAFVPEPFRFLIPILPNGSFPAVPSPKPISMSEAADADKAAAPWMMFIPEPFRTFIPILPNGSFPSTLANPAMPFFPFKMAEAGDADSGKLPAPWMMFIPEPFRTFIPILPNGSFPVVPPSPDASSPFKAFATEGDPKAAPPGSLPPSAWMNFIPEPFRVFIPLLPNGSFPASSVPALSAAAAGASPWASLVPEPFQAFVPMTPKNGAAPPSGPDDPVMWFAPSSATLPVPVFANGSFPWPPKPTTDTTNPWLPNPLNKKFVIPDFATPWLQLNPFPAMTPFAVPTKPSSDPSDWLNIIPGPFKYFIPRLPNGSFPWPMKPKTPVDKTMATEARQPDGSVLASLSATEPGRYTLFVKNGQKTTAYSFDVKKASSGGKTAGVAIATIAGIALVILAIAIVVRRLRRNPRRRGFNHLLSESAGQFSYRTI